MDSMDNTRVLLTSELFSPAAMAHFEDALDMPVLEGGPRSLYVRRPRLLADRRHQHRGRVPRHGHGRGACQDRARSLSRRRRVLADGRDRGYYLLGGEDAAAPEDMDEDEFDVLPDDHVIDVYPLIVAALLLEIPLIPLCDDDCKGLCSKCGPTSTRGRAAAPTRRTPTSSWRKTRSPRLRGLSSPTKATRALRRAKGDLRGRRDDRPWEHERSAARRTRAAREWLKAPPPKTPPRCRLRGYGARSRDTIDPTGRFSSSTFCARRSLRAWISPSLSFSASSPSDFFLRPADQIIGALGWILALFIALYAVRTGCQYFITCWGHIMGARMEADMRRDLFAQYQRLSFDYYDRHNTGAMMSKIVTDLFDISELAHHGPENLFICILKIAGSFALLFMINVPLTLIMLAVTAIMAAYALWRNYRKRVIFKENRARMAGINAAVQDSLGGIRVVKSFAGERGEERKFARANDAFLETKERSYRFMGSFHAVNSLFMGALYTVTVVGGGYFVACGSLQVTDLAIYALYIGIFISPVEQLINFTETLQKGYAGFRRFMEVLVEAPSVADAPGALPLSELEADRSGESAKRGEISYENVFFSYDGDVDVLNGLNLHVSAGETLALVGPSGGGDHHVLASAAVLRSDVGRGEDRRRGRARHHLGIAAQRHRHRAAGRLSVRRHGSGEHRLREGRCER